MATANYAARAFGVHSAMPTAQALRLCPNAVLVSGHRGRYSEMSDRVMAILASRHAQVWHRNKSIISLVSAIEVQKKPTAR